MDPELSESSLSVSAFFATFGRFEELEDGTYMY